MGGSSVLLPWQQLKTKKVNKKITAEFNLSYEWKDKKIKEFNDKKDFIVSYPEEYIWINIYFWIILLLLIIWWSYYYFIVFPKQKAKKEELMREKILNEINNKKE